MKMTKFVQLKLRGGGGECVIKVEDITYIMEINHGGGGGYVEYKVNVKDTFFMVDEVSYQKVKDILLEE